MAKEHIVSLLHLHYVEAESISLMLAAMYPPLLLKIVFHLQNTPDSPHPEGIFSCIVRIEYKPYKAIQEQWGFYICMSWIWKGPFVTNETTCLLVYVHFPSSSTASCALVWCSGCLSDTTTHHWWKPRAGSSVTSSSRESSCPTPWLSFSWPNHLLPSVPYGASAWARHSLSATLPCSPKPTESPGFSAAWKMERVQQGHASLARPLRWATAASDLSICIRQRDRRADSGSWWPNLPVLPSLFRCSSVWV